LMSVPTELAAGPFDCLREPAFTPANIRGRRPPANYLRGN